MTECCNGNYLDPHLQTCSPIVGVYLAQDLQKTKPFFQSFLLCITINNNSQTFIHLQSKDYK